MFFTYYQNNSGGSFADPAEYVIIEAKSPDEADTRAEKELDLYFNGVDKGIDCECCGDRWHGAWENGSPEPTIYGAPACDYRPYAERERALILYGDGTRETLKFKKRGGRA